MLLGRALTREMFTRQLAIWGLGVNLGAQDAEVSWRHEGTNPGYQSFLVFFPGRDEGVAVMTNGASQSGFYYEIVMAIAREYGWPGFDQRERKVVAVEPSSLRVYSGVWLADGAPEFEVVAQADKLFVQGGPFGPLRVRLYPTSPTSFFVLSTGFTFDFSMVAEGKATLGGGIAARRLRGR